MMKSMPVQVAIVAGCLAFSLGGPAVYAEEGHHHHLSPRKGMPVPRFIASTGKSFEALMDDAMAVMQKGMADAAMTGVSGHDFVAMMLPHHQGAIDMAKALLLTDPEPELRNLALGIIAEQQIEIQQMNRWLVQHPAH